MTKEEHDQSDQNNHEEETSEYLKEYEHAIFEMQKQYNHRNRNVPIIANKTQP